MIEDMRGDRTTDFWAERARELHWTRPWDSVLDGSDAPLYRWFAGGQLNAAENCLDRHIAAGNGDATAILFDSPLTGAAYSLSYRELLHEVSLFAGVLSGLGAGLGDTVLIHLPAIPENVIAMLACARLGITHVVVPSVPAALLGDRIDDAEPALILTASAGFENPEITPYKSVVDAALRHTRHQPRRCVVLQRPQAPVELDAIRDLEWSTLRAAATPITEPVPVPATHPLYLLYTSGSTGKPKAVVRDTGGYLTALHWAVRTVFGVGPGDVFWTDSHPGWVMGHSFTVYGALVSGCATVLYEGSATETPDAEAFGRLIAEYGVNVLSTTPMTLRRIRRAAPVRTPRTDGARVRGIFLASERVEPELMDWAMDFFGCPVIDNWWQTEAGWPITSNTLGDGLIPVKAGSVARPLPGWRVRIVDESGRELPPDAAGHVVVELPLPPGAVSTLWRDDDRFIATYLKRFPGYYDTSDAGHLDADGYLWIAGRTDDIINVGGDSLSGLDLEPILAAHPEVERCAVVASADPFYTEVPVAFITQRLDSAKPRAVLAGELADLVTERIGAWTRLRRFVFLIELPLTPSKKIRRSVLRQALVGVAEVTDTADFLVREDLRVPEDRSAQTE